jgi:hypothetical protein
MEGSNLEGCHMNFSLQDNQHGTLILQPVDASGAPVTDTQALNSEVPVSSDPTIMTATNITGFPGNVACQAVAPGNVTVTVTATNSAGATITTVFTFAVTGGPAMGFTAQLVNVATN